MPAEASRSGRAGPEPTPDAGRSPAIDRPVQHAPQATRRRPRSTPPARKDENPPEAIRHPARNDPPRGPRMSDGRLRRSPRHRSAEAITVSGLTFDMRGMPRLAGACPLDGRVRRPRRSASSIAGSIATAHERSQRSSAASAEGTSLPQ